MTENKNLITGATGDWEIVLGLEVHAQVRSAAKLFSGAATDYGGEPNTQVSFVDAAMPGMLPVINRKCVEQAIRTGLGLRAKINLFSVFDRKNYFYPDLPQGYQISQYQQPIVGEGALLIELEDGTEKSIGIERLHLEQDAGKSMHDQHPELSFVDLNRSGVALMEIVSKPDMRSVSEAQAYVKKLRAILRYLGTCDGNMEQGSLRADVNVSVRKPDADYGTRCEIKNVNSIRFIGQAIDYEARRQIAVLEDGGKVIQETRLFDPQKGETRAMRTKEEAHDYRYFPDPDLVPLTFTQAWVDEIAATLPELPDAKKARFIEAYGLTAYDANVLVAEAEIADFFEEVVTNGKTPRDAKAAANMVIGSVFAGLNRLGKPLAESPISATQIGQLLDLVSANIISGRIAKDVFDLMFEEGKYQGKDPMQIVEEKGLQQVTDMSVIEKAVDDVLAANPEKAAQAKEKPKLAGWFVGQVMQATAGKANPQAVNQLIREKLGLD
ncbi:MAG: Asp-tRNA(Asn)/Glu-tRNA(Gln) amidotransferase subunit GatB [Alphaproteobacteria bacterium]|nr:Asp-tRNA(Asn)/Glu-tRNA(Gln) amidotransferase subunit GatB [Alphaproteobacteria bacterium]